MYLLDANVFITAKNLYYAFDLAPGFWDWLSSALEDGTIGSIAKVHDEITSREDELQRWVEQQSGLDLEPDAAAIAALREIAKWTVRQDRFSPAAATEFLGIADYFLVGQAMAGNHVVVTHELPAPESTKVKIPDVCDAFGVEWISPFEMLRREEVRFLREP